MQGSRLPLVSAVLFSFSLGMAALTTPILAVRAGYSVGAVGLLITLSALAQMVVRMGLNTALRLWSDWTLVAGAAALLAASCGALAVSPALTSFVLSQILLGAARACFWTGIQTHVVRGSGSTLKPLAVTNLAGSVGQACGPLLAGVMVERSAALAMAAAAAVALVGLVPASRLPRLPPFLPVSDGAPGGIWRQPAVAAGCWASYAVGGWRGLLSSYVPVVLDAADHSAGMIGVLMFMANTAAIVGIGAVARLPNELVRLTYAAASLFVGGGVAAAALLPHSAAVVGLSLCLSGISAGSLQSLGPAMATQGVRPEERGQAIVAVGTARAGAQFAAPFAAVALVSAFPLGAAVAVVGLLLALPVLWSGKAAAARKAG